MWLHLTAANDYTDQSTRYPWYTLQTPVEIVIGKFQDTKWSPELFRRRWMNYIKIVLKHFVYSCVLTKSHRVIPQRPAALLQLHMLWLIQYHWKCWIYKGYAVSCARKHARAYLFCAFFMRTSDRLSAVPSGAIAAFRTVPRVQGEGKAIPFQQAGAPP